MNLYEQLNATPGGRARLASARLRYSVKKALFRALEVAGLSQAELANRLGVRRSAVNAVFQGEGNLRLNTLADYLHAMGFEAHLEISPIGSARSRFEWEVTHEANEAAAVQPPRRHDDLGWTDMGTRSAQLELVIPARRSDYARAA